MTEDAIFETWAPRGGRWTPWVKPVLFAYINSVSKGDSLPACPGLEGVKAAPHTAVVIDLPGPESVAASLTIATRGWRPIPLFNALPHPAVTFGSTPRVPVAVDILPIIAALRTATPALEALRLSSTASPAFLLDSRRGSPDWKLQPPAFDNRSISFPTDFPSAVKLREHGISRVLLIQIGRKPDRDLEHTLRQWQKDGLAIELLEPGPNAQSQPCPIRNTGRLALWFLKLVALFNLHRSAPGVYGRTVLPASS